MPPRKFEAKDTVFAVSQAIITVLRYSTNRAFVSASLSHLKANTLEEAEQRLGQHLWSILHRHQGTDIPPEVAEEISSLPLQQHAPHTQTTTDFQDSPGNDDSTPELWHKNPCPVRFREEGSDESLFFPPFVEEGGLDSADHTTALLTDASSATGFYHGLSFPEDTLRIQLMQNPWLHPWRSSTPLPTPLPHPGTRSENTASCQVHVGPTTTSEHMVSTMMTSNYSDETQILEGTTGQERGDSHLDPGVPDKGGCNVFTSRTGEATLSDSSLLPPIQNSLLGPLEKTRLLQVLSCDKDVTTGSVGERTTHKNRPVPSKNKIEEAVSLLSYISDHEEPFASQTSMTEAAISELSETMAMGVCRANPPQDHEQCVRSQPFSPISQNSFQNSKRPGLAQGQGLCGTADSSQEFVSLLREADEHWPTRDQEALDLLLDYPSSVHDEDTQSVDSISILHDSNVPWPCSDEFDVIDVVDLDFHDTRGTEQVDTKDDSEGAENDDTKTKNEVPRTRCGKSKYSCEAEISIISETVISTEESVLRNSCMLKNQSSESELTEFPEDGDDSKDTEDLLSESSTQNNTSSGFPSDISSSSTSKCDLAASIKNPDISLQKQDISNTNRGEQIRSDRISQTNSCVCPSQQHSSLLPAGKSRALPLSSQNDTSVFLDYPHRDISFGDKQTQDSQSECCRSTTSFLPSVDKSTHCDITSVPMPNIPSSSSNASKKLCFSYPNITEKSVSAQETHLVNAAMKQVLHLSEEQVLPDQNRSDSNLAQTFHPKHVLPNPADEVVFIPKQASADPTGHDEGLLQPSLEQVSPKPDVSDEGVIKFSQEQMSAGSTGLNEKKLQPLPEQVSLYSNGSEKGVAQLLSQEVIENLNDSEGDILKSLPDQLSLYSNGIEEGIAQELTENLTDSEEDILKFLSDQLSPYPDRDNKDVLQPLNEQPTPYPKNGLLSPQCNQLLPYLHDNDDGGPENSSSLLSIDSNESDQDDNSESLLKGITYDPILTALLSAEFPSTHTNPSDHPASETCDPTHHQIMDTVLPAVSNHQDTEPLTHSKNYQTQNTDSCVYKSLNLMVATDMIESVDNSAVQKTIHLELSLLTKDAPCPQRHRVGNLRPEDFVSEVPDPNKLHKTLPLSSPSINRVDEDMLPTAAKEKLTVHEKSQGKSFGMISGQDPLQTQRSCGLPVFEIEPSESLLSNQTERYKKIREFITSEDDSSQLMHPEGESNEPTTPVKKIPQHVSEQCAHPLARDIPQYNMQDIKVHEKEVYMPKNKLTKLPEVEDDLPKLSGNKLHEVIMTEDALKTARVPQDKFPQVIQPKTASNKPLVLEVTLPDNVLQDPRFVKDNLLELQTQDTDLDIVPENVLPELTVIDEEKEERAIPDDKLPEVTIPVDDLWEENIPEVAIPEDNIQRFALPDVTRYGNVEEGIMPDATMPKDPVDVLVVEDRIPDITMLEATVVQDNSMEAMVLADEPSMAGREQPDHSSVVMAIRSGSTSEQVPTGLPCDVTMLDDSSEMMIIDYEFASKQVPTGSLSCDVTMFNNSSEMIIESEAVNKQMPTGRLSCDVTMLDLASSEHQLSENVDYDSDDFVW